MWHEWSGSALGHEGLLGLSQLSLESTHVIDDKKESCGEQEDTTQTSVGHQLPVESLGLMTSFGTIARYLIGFFRNASEIES